MVRNTASKGKKAPEKDVKQPFRFLNLPAEIRVEVYRQALVNNQGWPSWQRTKRTLRPPALAQVCNQVRAEVLPIYYGENAFYISMDIDVIGYVENMFPVREDDNSQLNKFLDMCSAIVPSGGLQFITNSEFCYSEPVFEGGYNYLLGFTFARNPDVSDRPERVGDENLDWEDSQMVAKEFRAALKQSVTYEYTELEEHVPVDSVIQVLFAFAKHCHKANRYVTLSWDYGH